MRKLALIFCVIVASATGLGLARAADGDFRQVVTGLVDNYNKSFNAKNTDGVLSSYTDDGAFIAADGHVYKGKDQIKTFYKANFDAGVTDHTATVTDAQADADSGFAYGTWGASAPGKGGAAMKIGGSWSASYVKGPDGWHAKMIFASVPPPAPPAK